MAVVASKTLNPSEPDLTPIRKQVLQAVKVIFDRSIARNPDAPEIRDNKDDLPASGNLQDCEFGMILLIVHEWLRDDSLEDDFFADIPPSDFGRAIIALVSRVVDRVLRRQQPDEGGEGNEKVTFFIGEPYTRYKKDPKDRTFRFSANLDAAMITLAFLAPAVEQFNEELAFPYNREGLELPSWVQSLRDAALFVILDGLKYALDCRVINNGKFRGFTSDPHSNLESPEDGGIESDNDRLFFTWTTCETINDLKLWRDSYLNKRFTTMPPEPLVTEAKSLIKDLDAALLQSAEWCELHFLPQFQQFTIPETRDLIREVTQLGDRKLEDKTRQVDQMELSVQHVYHLSQYAAIRSLAPERVSLEEVSTIADKLDRLVSTSIMGSQLDASTNENLFRTLTRRYSLGTSNPMGYTDDAWYPLVVRSLSGLLSRSLTEIGKRFVRSEVLKLTQTFQRSLENHVGNLLARRARIDDDGDGQLWSFAEGQPYVLYATQRTIFALIQYATFLRAVDEFQKLPDLDRREEELSMMFARRFSDFFKPVIKELIAQATPPPVVVVAPPAPTHDLPLPEEAWAAPAIGEWLKSFTEDFKQSQVAHNLSQRAQTLLFIKKWVDGYQPSSQLDDRASTNVQQQHDKLKEEFAKIEAQLGGWDEEKLTARLFGYLFRHYMQRPASPIENLLDDDSTELWKLIQDTEAIQESISNADKTFKLP